MDLLKQIFERAKANPQRIVLQRPNNLMRNSRQQDSNAFAFWRLIAFCSLCQEIYKRFENVVYSCPLFCVP